MGLLLGAACVGHHILPPGRGRRTFVGGQPMRRAPLLASKSTRTAHIFSCVATFERNVSIAHNDKNQPPNHTSPLRLLTTVA